MSLFTEINQTFPKATQPSSIKIPLKTHQLTLIEACKKVEQSSHVPLEYTKDGSTYTVSTKCGFMCDPVGSGKTLSILGLIDSSRITSKTLPEFKSHTHLKI